MTVFRSTLYFIWFLAVSVALNLGALPLLALPRRLTVAVARWWAALLLWGLRVFAGLEFEVRGTRPARPVLVAAKHMSMWDTIALYYVLHDPAIILKQELLSIPFYGWYARKTRMIAIDRGGRANALRRMAAAARAALAQGRPVVIFPEGTRKQPGAAPDYKSGVAGLYGQIETACIPVALNSGLFWKGFIKKPGRVVLEFLEPIPAGLARGDFMRALELRIETGTARLLAEGQGES